MTALAAWWGSTTGASLHRSEKRRKARGQVRGSGSPGHYRKCFAGCTELGSTTGEGKDGYVL